MKLYIQVVVFWTLNAALVHAQITFDQLALTGELVPGATDQAVFGTLGYPVLNDSGQVAFSALLETGSGATVTFDNDEAVFGPLPGAPESMGIIAREGNLAAGTVGGEVFGTFSFSIPPDVFPVQLNGTGDVAFLGSVLNANGDSGSLEYAIFGPTAGSGSALGIVAREDEPAPGVSDGAEFRFFNDPVLNDRGDILFESLLRTGTGGTVTGLNEYAIHLARGGQPSSLELIAREDDLAPDVQDGAEFSEFDSLALNDNGDVLFESELRTGIGDDVTSSNRDAIFGPSSGSGSLLGVVARSGMLAPGTIDNANFSRFIGLPAFNNSGDVAFRADLTAINSDALFGPVSAANSDLGLIAREGDLAPGISDGAVFSQFTSTPALNNNGDVAFEAFLDPNTEVNRVDAIFGPISGSGSSLSQIIRQGDAVPNIQGDYEFDYSRAPVLNDIGNMVFLSGLRPTGTSANDNNQNGLFAYIDGELMLIVKEGDEFEVISSSDSNGGGDGSPKEPDGQVENRTISEIFFDAANDSGVGFNHENVLAFGIRFTDGSEGIFTARIGIVPEPSSMTLALLLSFYLANRRYCC